MGEVTTIGLDLAKQVFHVHGANASGAAQFSKRVSRAKLVGFFASQPRCTVRWRRAAARINGRESCSSSGMGFVSFRQTM